MIPRVPFVVARRPGVGQEILIAAAGATAITSGNPAATFGAWTALSTPASDYYISQLGIARVGIPASADLLVVEFGYGAGPTQIDAMRVNSNIADPGADDSGWITLTDTAFFPKVPANQSLQARAYDGNVASQTFHVWTAGWSGTVPTFTVLPKQSPSGGGRWYPSDTAVAMNVTTALAPAFGAYSDVVNPAPNDLLVVAIDAGQALQDSARTGVAYLLGIGAPGAERAVAVTLVSHQLYPAPIYPPVWVKAGEQLRIAGSTNGATTVTAAVKVYDF